MGKPVNPYCNCDPCKCEPPCICGLKLISREVETAWDEAEQKLKYQVEEVYVPSEGSNSNV